jgi:nitrogen fixation/metabolism regulation signal transduction histidine kinase
MGSERGPTFAGFGIARGVALRAAAIAALVLVAFGPLGRTHLWAAAALVAAGLVLLDLARLVARADRQASAFLDGLTAGEAEAPERPLAGFPRLHAGMVVAAATLRERRAAARREIDRRDALLDTVPAALIAVAADGRVELVNRSARRLAAGPASRLEDLAALGPAAASLAPLAPGAREVVRLADGRRALAAAASFASAEGLWRLISLQTYSGDLDAVEIEAWRDLTRILAHEIMNSLTPVVSLAESLGGLIGGEGENTASEAAAVADVIARRSTGLMSFVDRYRRLADLPAPALQDVELDEFASRIERSARALRPAAPVHFACRIVPPDLEARADPDLLEQAVLNLVKNGIEAAQGRKEIRIELTCRREEDGRVSISVADNGPGLCETPDVLFAPFHTTKAEGRGVGLSLARQISVAHGGELHVAPNRPSGAIFVLTLPDQRPDAA